MASHFFLAFGSFPIPEMKIILKNDNQDFLKVVKMRMKIYPKIRTFLETRSLWVKLIVLISGAGLFFVLFPFLLRYGTVVYILYIIFLFCFGVLFRIVSDKKTFRVTLWLWGSGSLIYMIIAIVLILRGSQPLPYITLEPLHLVLYYISYPLRVLGIFFAGLLFAEVTSPVEFLRFGEIGLKIAMAYRAFEYSVNAFEVNRVALTIQGEWPDISGGKIRFKEVLLFLKYAPVLVSTTFRNIILWFPWAWICYSTIKNDLKLPEK